MRHQRPLFSVLSSAISRLRSSIPRVDRELYGAIVSEDTNTAEELVAVAVPSLLFARGSDERSGGVEAIGLKVGPHLDRRLHRETILEAGAATLVTLRGRGPTILASDRRGALWRSGDHSGVVLHEVAAPEELARDERLKDRLRSERFVALLALIQFLRNLARSQWKRPSIRVSFVFDDANLPWRSYGHFRYRSLVDHAVAHGYHVDIATIPLEGWFADRAAPAGLRRDGPLALLAHGNNHTSRELGQPLTTEEAMRMVVLACRRVPALERRSGVMVQRVLSPPHGSISETVMSALRRNGFDGTCYWRLTDAALAGLVDLDPSDEHLGEGLPSVHRVPLDVPLDELVLRSFLDQPRLLSGHHSDLATGQNLLTEACQRLDRLGDVQRASVSGMLLSKSFTRQERTALYAFHFLAAAGSPSRRRYGSYHRIDPRHGKFHFVNDSGAGGPRDAPRSVRAGEHVHPCKARILEICQDTDGEVGPLGCRETAQLPWPIMRRCLTEGRHRVQPLLRPARTVGGTHVDKQ